MQTKWVVVLVVVTNVGTYFWKDNDKEYQRVYAIAYAHESCIQNVNDELTYASKSNLREATEAITKARAALTQCYRGR